VSSTLFILIHIPGRLDEFAQDPVIMPLKYFAAAVVLCRIRVATGSIWWPTAFHTLWNFLVSAQVWGAFGSSSVLGVLALTEFFVGIGLALTLPTYEKFASSRLFIQYKRWRIPVDLGVPYHRKLWAQALTSSKVRSRWSVFIRGRVVGGVRQPTPEQPPSVGSRGR
jgi:hypothetical protein